MLVLAGTTQGNLIRSRNIEGRQNLANVSSVIKVSVGKYATFITLLNRFKKSFTESGQTFLCDTGFTILSETIEAGIIVGFDLLTNFGCLVVARHE